MTFIINTTCNVKYREMVNCSLPGENAGITSAQWTSASIHLIGHSLSQTNVSSHLYNNYPKDHETTKTLPTATAACILMFSFARALVDADILLCQAFVDINNFLCNLDHNNFLFWPTGMPRQWGTRPIPRPRSRNTMCRPKQTDGSW